MKKTIEQIREAKDELRNKIKSFIYNEVSKFETENKVQINFLDIELNRDDIMLVGENEPLAQMFDVDVLIDVRI